MFYIFSHYFVWHVLRVYDTNLNIFFKIRLFTGCCPTDLFVFFNSSLIFHYFPCLLKQSSFFHIMSVFSRFLLSDNFHFCRTWSILRQMLLPNNNFFHIIPNFWLSDNFHFKQLRELTLPVLRQQPLSGDRIPFCNIVRFWIYPLPN